MIEELKQPDCDNPDNILDGAKGRLNRVIVIGDDKDGNLYCASSTSYKPMMLWMVALFLKELLK